jgi:hypothetical protein
MKFKRYAKKRSWSKKRKVYKKRKAYKKTYKRSGWETIGVEKVKCQYKA